MMGRTHALTGVVAGLAVAPLVGVTRPAAVGVFAAVCAGWALVPDLDHPSSSASRLLGPVTRALSAGLRIGTGAFYRLTKGPRDEAGTHRTVTHTALFAAIVGALIGWGGALTPWVPLAVALFGVLLAADRLGDWLLAAAAVGVGAALVGPGWVWLLGQVAVLSWAAGVAAGLGCLVHVCGDMVTISGAPLLFPLPIKGETYWELRPPSALRFRTNGSFERIVVFPLFVVVGVLLLPGVWPWIAYLG